MNGPQILTRSLTVPGVADKFGNTWQYHSRSDRHSKISCWGVLFDLLQHCPLLAKHAADGRIVFGINHRMVDFKNNRKKNLDLVLCTPGSGLRGKSRDLKAVAEKYGVVLTREEMAVFDGLPDLREGPVGSVHVALEAKACMTEHSKARPRLYDELNSSHLTIHGCARMAIAVGFVMVNAAPTFVSTDLNKFDLRLTRAQVTTHGQPGATRSAIEKVTELPRRAKTDEDGFDALGIVVVDCRNDGSPVKLVERPPAPEPGDSFHYDSMIRRTAQLYESRFPRV